MMGLLFRGSPYIMVGSAQQPVALNANARRPEAPEVGLPDFPVAGLMWTPPPSWVPIRPRSSRDHLTIIK
jgi:hypothetical protein